MPTNSILGEPRSAELFDQSNEILALVSVLAGKPHELASTADHGTALRTPGDADSPAAAKLEQSLVPQGPKRSQHRVGVDPDHGRQVTRRWKTLARFCLTVSDGAPDLGGNLLVQVRRIAPVNLDIQHGASNTSSIVPVEAPPSPPVDDELDALIEEARRRARRRRIGYTAVIVGVLAAAGGLYLGFSGGGGADGGTTLRGNAPPGGSAGHGSARSASASSEDVYRRCPGRGLEALPLTGAADQATLGIAERRVGFSPQITTTVRPATDAGIRGEAVSSMCGPKIARRTLVVFTWNHRFDHGPNKSASLAQGVFLVSRFTEGYRLWYWEH